MRVRGLLLLLIPSIIPTLVWGCGSSSLSMTDTGSPRSDAAPASDTGVSNPGTDTGTGTGTRDAGGAPDTGTNGQDTGAIGQDTGTGTGTDAAPNADATPNADAAPGPDTGPHPSPGVCIPDPTQTGNSINVGAYCTAGGHQCAQYNMGLSCAIDVDPMGQNFCIKIGFCQQASDCAEEACCTGRAGNPIHACIPKQCVAPDAGVDCPPPP
jgi:hypothetical protein